MSASPEIREDIQAPTIRSPEASSTPGSARSAACSRPRGGKAELTSVAWAAEGELSYDEWLRHGCRLGVAGRSAAWWIGDWVRYGAARYGRKYEVASRVTGFEHQTLMNMVYVATRFAVSLRRENLSWSHHAELAALDVHEQDRWLDRATAERLTVRSLRNELIAARQRTKMFDMRGAPRAIEARRTSASTAQPRGTPRWVGDNHANANALSRRAEQASDQVWEGKVVTCPRCGHHFMESILISTVTTGHGSSVSTATGPQR